MEKEAKKDKMKGEDHGYEAYDELIDDIDDDDGEDDDDGPSYAKTLKAKSRKLGYTDKTLASLCYQLSVLDYHNNRF